MMGNYYSNDKKSLKSLPVAVVVAISSVVVGASGIVIVFNEWLIMEF